MKKVFLISVILLFVVGLTGCSNNNKTPTENVDNQDSDNVEENNIVEENNDIDDKVLVVYFSATGTTRKVAEMIADITDADIYEILPLEEYSSDDLNWHDSNSRTTKEQNDSSSRPEIASEDINLNGYNKIFIGYPIWWGEEPRIMDTFVEKYNFDDITMIPFCTSSSSVVGRSDSNLEENAKSGTWLDGKRFGASVSEEEVKSFIESIN